jgi:predicted ATPase with chaperone activity
MIFICPIIYKQSLGIQKFIVGGNMPSTREDFEILRKALQKELNNNSKFCITDLYGKDFRKNGWNYELKIYYINDGIPSEGKYYTHNSQR